MEGFEYSVSLFIIVHLAIALVEEASAEYLILNNCITVKLNLG